MKFYEFIIISFMISLTLACSEQGTINLNLAADDTFETTSQSSTPDIESDIETPSASITRHDDDTQGTTGVISVGNPSEVLRNSPSLYNTESIFLLLNSSFNNFAYSYEYSAEDSVYLNKIIKFTDIISDEIKTKIQNNTVNYASVTDEFEFILSLNDTIQIDDDTCFNVLISSTERQCILTTRFKALQKAQFDDKGNIYLRAWDLNQNKEVIIQWSHTDNWQILISDPVSQWKVLPQGGILAITKHAKRSQLVKVELAGDINTLLSSRSKTPLSFFTLNDHLALVKVSIDSYDATDLITYLVNIETQSDSLFDSWIVWSTQDINLKQAVLRNNGQVFAPVRNEIHKIYPVERTLTTVASTNTIELLTLSVNHQQIIYYAAGTLTTVSLSKGVNRQIQQALTKDMVVDQMFSKSNGKTYLRGYDTAKQIECIQSIDELFTLNTIACSADGFLDMM